MKTSSRIAVMTIILFLSVQGIGQVPQKISYQAVARDASGNPICDHALGIKFSIREGSASGTDLYVETMTSLTNSMGTFSVEIGGGTPVTGSFSNIQWGSGLKFLNIQIDPAGGTAYTDMGSYQILSVAYAQYARDVLNNDDEDPDPENEFQILSIAGDQLSISNGNTVTLPSGGSCNWQTSGSNIYYNGGNVGIGTTNPTTHLDIRGSSTNEGAWLKIGNSDQSHSLMIYGGQQNDPNPCLYWKQGDYFSFATDENVWSEKMRITSDGKVGIGTTVPTAKLEVYGADAMINGQTVGKGGGNVVGNLAVGEASLSSNTTGSYNTAVGYNALSNNTTGNANTAFGLNALRYNTTGYTNQAFGFWALINNTTGYFNTASGCDALVLNSTGFQNNAYGVGALKNNTTGSNNIAMGYHTLGENTSGTALNDNIAIGTKAGGTMTTGAGNVVIGDETGKNLTTGSDNVWIGRHSGNSGNHTISNTVVIGMGVGIPTTSNRVHIGNSGMTFIGGQVTWSTYSDMRYKTGIRNDIPGLDFILKLNPVTFQWDVEGLNRALGLGTQDQSSSYRDIEEMRITGFLAQEVEAAAKSVGFDFSGVDHAGGVYSLSYSQFVVPLVKAVQELKAENDLLKARLDAMEQLIKSGD